MGPRGSAAEVAFCNTLTNQKRGDNALLALVAPNLMAKPATLMFNKVEIKNGDQASQMFGPAQRGVAKAVVDSVKAGVIPEKLRTYSFASACLSIGKLKTIRKSKIGIMKRPNWRSPER
jgi:formaldehyde-activating enzyme